MTMAAISGNDGLKEHDITANGIIAARLLHLCPGHDIFRKVLNEKCDQSAHT
jgi:hypothetical protein